MIVSASQILDLDSVLISDGKKWRIADLMVNIDTGEVVLALYELEDVDHECLMRLDNVVRLLRSGDLKLGTM